MENLSHEYFEKKKILLNCVGLAAASLICKEFMQMFPAESDFGLKPIISFKATVMRTRCFRITTPETML